MKNGNIAGNPEVKHPGDLGIVEIYDVSIKSPQDGIGYEGVTGLVRLFIRLSDKLLLGK